MAMLPLIFISHVISRKEIRGISLYCSMLWSRDRPSSVHPNIISGSKNARSSILYSPLPSFQTYLPSLLRYFNTARTFSPPAGIVAAGARFSAVGVSPLNDGAPPGICTWRGMLGSLGTEEIGEEEDI